MTSTRVTSHCMMSRCGVKCSLGLFEKDHFINMQIFNKLRVMVLEII